jgi:signal transduction histidine kinase
MNLDYDTEESDFLPAPRYRPEEIASQRQELLSLSCSGLLYELPMIMFIINDRRQIIWMNRKAADTISGIAGDGDASRSIGLRPGEALGCIHACEKPGGCGTSLFCSYCGAPAAIMKALAGAEDSEECIIQLQEEYKLDALDLLVWSKPLEQSAGKYILFLARDISTEKRQEVLERIFYHDIGNTVSGIRSMLELITMAKDEEGVDYLKYLRSATEQLIEEIDSQRALKAAETGTLFVDKSPMSIDQEMQKAVELFDYACLGKDMSIKVESSCPGATLYGDPALLRRVMVNMLKNAFEASTRGDSIRIGCGDQGDALRIWVWNAAVMSGEAKLRMFQRSFSTKGKGRGLGSYGMKILAERYLGGTVSFVSEEGAGTTFSLLVPKDPAP